MNSAGDIERALIALADRIEIPPEPELAPAVADRIRALPARTRRIRMPVVWTRRAIALAAAIVLLVSGIAVGTYFGVRGVRVRFEPPPALTPTTSVGATLNLGTRSTLQAARGRLPFPVRVPVALGDPDEVYLDFRILGGEVTLLYRPRAGLPEAAATKTGLLLLEFEGRWNRASFDKFVAPRQLREVKVGGAPALWIEGAHSVGYLDSVGAFVADTVRLSGSVLLWQIGDVTLRLESALPMSEAIRIAESVR